MLQAEVSHQFPETRTDLVKRLSKTASRDCYLSAARDGSFCPSYPPSMPRPSRIVEAKEMLRAHYTERGLMPSLTAFAELMGLRGASSVQELASELVENGFLAREGRSGRLLPGPGFARTASRVHSLPKELAAALPKGVELEVVLVAVDSMVGDGVLRGDFLVVAPAERTDLSKTLLLARGRGRALAETPTPGWRVLGVVVAQFRAYQ
jgi:hypothetical protein